MCRNCPSTEILTMEDINKHCDDNLGGVFLLNFIPVKEVASLAAPVDNKVCEALVTTATGRWRACYGTEGTIKFTEDLQEDPNGDFHKVKLMLFTPKDRTELSNTLNLMRNKKFIVEYTDNNNHRKIIGTPDEPLSFRYSLDTGNAVPSRNGYALEFYGDVVEKSPTYFV